MDISKLAKIMEGGGEDGEWWAFSGDPSSLNPELELDLMPYSDLISFDPSHVSLNLWMGQKGVVTPCHFDGYHNM